MLRKDFIQRKISLIQDDLAKLTELSEFSIHEIAKDYVKQAAVERILERVITRAIDINSHIVAEAGGKDTSPPKEYRETFLRLAELGIFPRDFAENIAKSIGTRNMLVHEYNNVDYNQIYQSLGDCLRDYEQYVDYLLAFLSGGKRTN